MENDTFRSGNLQTQPGIPSPAAQSWGAFISMIIIVLMIVIGAFYAWGQRVAQENALIMPSSAQESL